jgi:hypothetical protein
MIDETIKQIEARIQNTRIPYPGAAAANFSPWSPS